MAVVTTDNKAITHKCLKQLGIADIFDKIYTEDGHTPVKPTPYCAIDFPLTLICSLIVVVCGIFSATDIKSLLHKNSKLLNKILIC